MTLAPPLLDAAVEVAKGTIIEFIRLLPVIPPHELEDKLEGVCAYISHAPLADQIGLIEELSWACGRYYRLDPSTVESLKRTVNEIVANIDHGAFTQGEVWRCDDESQAN